MPVIALCPSLINSAHIHYFDLAVISVLHCCSSAAYTMYTVVDTMVYTALISLKILAEKKSKSVEKFSLMTVFRVYCAS